MKNAKKFSWRFGVMFCSLGLLFLLAACGSSSTSGTGSTGGGNVPPPARPTATGTGSITGCPSNEAVTGSPAKANVTVQANTVKDAVNAQTGDLIEVRLPFGQKWSGPSSSLGVLQIQDPIGYPLTSAHVCIWRFQAKASGSATLDFTGRAICGPGKMCPLYVENISFTVNVK